MQVHVAMKLLELLILQFCSAFPGIDAEKLAEEERFLDRIRRVLTRSHWQSFGKSLVFQSLYWMLVTSKAPAKKARDQERAAAHPKRKITFVFIPLSVCKAEPRHLDDIFSGKYRVVYMNPEKALHPLVVRKLWANEAFRGLIATVDEAYLVHDWERNSGRRMRTWERLENTLVPVLSSILWKLSQTWISRTVITIFYLVGGVDYKSE
ncbi:hypothetical protein V8E54_010250 [Elaphomyces granulatus]